MMIQRMHHNVLKAKRSVVQNPMITLAARVSSKLEEGDYRGAVRSASSQEKFAGHSAATTAALRLKHPLRQADSVIEVQPQYSRPSFSADVDMVRRAIMSFPSGSGSGNEGFLSQHLKDLIGPVSQEGVMALLNALTSLVNLILEGRTPPLIRPILFGAKLTALTKEKGDVRPIAVGRTIRSLASKCACQHALTSIPNILAPHQLGFGVPGLHLNVSKSEVIASDQSVVGNLLSEFPGLWFTHHLTGISFGDGCNGMGSPFPVNAIIFSFPS
jgi:hypothetical protein